MLIAFLIFIISFVTTLAMYRFALRRSILDIPNERSSHQYPVPRGGGVGIVIAFSFSLLYLVKQHAISSDLFYALMGGGLCLAVGSFIDDIVGLKSRWRLILHFAVALWAIYWLGGLNFIDLGTFQLAMKWQGSTLLAIIAIVWLINLYNFMDGIDGLAGIEGLTTAACASFALWLLGYPNFALLLGLLGASIAGFIFLNWPPAKIFLGDIGSAYLGYVFAVIGIATAKVQALPLTFWLIMLAIFICDATFTVVNRAWQGKQVYSAHREHAYQHLTIYGASHKQITFSIGLINLFILFPIALTSLNHPENAFWYLSIILIGCLCSWLFIKRLPLSGEA